MYNLNHPRLQDRNTRECFLKRKHLACIAEPFFVLLVQLFHSLLVLLQCP